jgi:hypothetical protein
MATIRDIAKWMSKDTLFNEINIRRRQFFIEKVQAPLLSKVLKLAKLYPEPTIDKVRTHNGKVWLEIFDEILRYEANPRLREIEEAGKRLVIGKHESSNNYAERMAVLVELVAEKYNSGEFLRRKPWTPTTGWSDPSVVGARLKRTQSLMKDIGIEEEQDGR